MKKSFAGKDVQFAGNSNVSKGKQHNIFKFNEIGSSGSKQEKKIKIPLYPCEMTLTETLESRLELERRH